jgi:hypothetical protein
MAQRPATLFRHISGVRELMDNGTFRRFTRQHSAEQRASQRFADSRFGDSMR